MTSKRYLVLDATKGYPFGVLAGPSVPMQNGSPTNELHGPFASREDAVEYIRDLKAEYSDYEEFTVVKIEVPAA